MNLGTLKAFGLSNKETNKLYVQIMFLFCIIGDASGFIAYCIGKLIDKLIGSFLIPIRIFLSQITDGLIVGIIFLIFLISMLSQELLPEKKFYEISW